MGEPLPHYGSEAVLSALSDCSRLQRCLHILLCGLLQMAVSVLPKLLGVAADEVTAPTVKREVASAVKVHVLSALEQERAATVGAGDWAHLVDVPQVPPELLAILRAEMTAFLKADLGTRRFLVVSEMLLQLSGQGKLHLANRAQEGIGTEFRVLPASIQQALRLRLMDCRLLSRDSQALACKAQW